MRRRAPSAEPGSPPADVAAVVEAAKRYFAGEEIDFSQVQVDLAGQDAFFAQIYGALRRVGWGRTTTYGALAKEVGAGREAARDVGEAMAKNPTPLIIPCHRVLAAGGKIGGFSAPGGSKTKARMLELEGVRLGPPEAAQRLSVSEHRPSRYRQAPPLAIACELLQPGRPYAAAPTRRNPREVRSQCRRSPFARQLRRDRAYANC